MKRFFADEKSSDEESEETADFIESLKRPLLKSKNSKNHTLGRFYIYFANEIRFSLLNFK